MDITDDNNKQKKYKTTTTTTTTTIMDQQRQVMFQSQHPLLKTLFPEGNLRRSMRRRPATVLYTFQDHHHRHHNGILIVNRHHDPHFHRHRGSGGHPVQNLHWCSYQQSRLEDLPLREVYQAQREPAVKVACYLLLSHLH